MVLLDEWDERPSVKFSEPRPDRLSLAQPHSAGAVTKLPPDWPVLLIGNGKKEKSGGSKQVPLTTSIRRPQCGIIR